MSESLIYWITRLDGIRNCIDGLTIPFTVLSVIGVIVWISFSLIKDYSNENSDDYKFANAILSKFVPLTILCIAIAICINIAYCFIPSTKEMIAINVIPQIATKGNCQKLQNISKDFLDVTAKWLEDLKTKNNK